MPRSRTTIEPPPVHGARWIQLTQGKFAIVDEADYGLVSQYNWHPLRTRNKMREMYYACTHAGRLRLYMHRLILGARRSEATDHVDGNGLNNLRANLRFCTYAQNARNRGVTIANSSGFKGVSFHKATGYWRARIVVDYAEQHIGLFRSPIEAAHAYDAAAMRLHGAFAQLNLK